MPDGPKTGGGNGRASVIKRLVQETGITETQAAELVAILGTDWSSLVREAHLLTKKR